MIGSIEIQINQDGDFVSGTVDIVPKSWVYLTDIPIPPTSHHFHFSGIIEGSNMTIWYDEPGAPSWLDITMEFSFTTLFMQGTISGTMIESDTNAIKLTKQRSKSNTDPFTST